jgi:hypothetical protein
MLRSAHKTNFAETGRVAAPFRASIASGIACARKANCGPLSRGPDWMPITPEKGVLIPCRNTAKGRRSIRRSIAGEAEPQRAQDVPFGVLGTMKSKAASVGGLFHFAMGTNT